MKILEELETGFDAAQMYVSPFLPPFREIAAENESFPVPSITPTSVMWFVISCSAPDGPVRVIDNGLPPNDVQVTLNSSLFSLKIRKFRDRSSTGMDLHEVKDRKRRYTTHWDNGFPVRLKSRSHTLTLCR